MRRPGRTWAWLLALALVAVALLVLRSPRLDLSFAGLMDRDDPEIAAYFERSRAWGLGGRLPLLIEGPEDRLDEAVSAVRERLEADASVSRTYAGVPAAWARDHAYWLMNGAALHDLQASFEAGGRAPSPSSAPPVAPVTDDPSWATDGARLVVVTLTTDSFELDLDAQPLPHLQAIARETLARFEARGSWAGMPAVVEQDQAGTLRRIAWLSPLSLGLALALLLGLERRPLGLLAIAAPMVLSAVTTIAIVGLVTGRITLMESLFGIIVFGLGVDFAIHLGVRAGDEHRAGHDFEQAVRRAHAYTGPGVLAGAVTTAVAFAGAATAPEPTFVHLGITGAVGVLLCCAAMLVGLPAAWRWLGRRVPGPSRTGGTSADDDVPPSPRGLQRLTFVIARHALTHPRRHLLVAVALVGLGVLGLLRLRYEQDLAQLVSDDVQAIETASRIQEAFGVDPDPWVLPADDLAQARAFEAALRDTAVFSSVSSAASLLPDDLQARTTWLRSHAATIRTHLRDPAATTRSPGLAVLARALETTPPTLKTLPATLRAELVAPDGRLLVYATSTHAHLDADQARREREAARRICPEASSLAVLIERILAKSSGSERPWMPRVLATVAALLLVVLVIDLRRPRWIALALLPVTLGGLLTFGLLGWLGVPLNLVALLGAPLVLGVGIDDGIHVVHRLRQAPPREHATAVASVGRAIALTTATTCASFATLVLSGHAGLVSMGLTMLIALPVCWWASCSTLPAAAAVTDGRRARR